MRLSKLFAYVVFLVLFLIFAVEVIISFIRWREGKVGLSITEVQSEYVKFPSISICIDQDAKKEELGFKQIRPLNETLRDVDFVRHLNNGYMFGLQVKIKLHNYAIISLRP